MVNSMASMANMDPQTRLLWFGSIAAGCAMFGQAFKTDQGQKLLAVFGVKQVPSVWLPRIALLLGLGAGVATALSMGEQPLQAVLTALQGLLASALPTALHETTTERKLTPEAAPEA